MPLFDPFAHYLAYLATDQETFRDLRGAYNGVLVPGTIAAWQRQGTGGFVLSLSATEASPPYVIDPRFPLFQQALRSAKQSHLALADIFEDRTLVKDTIEPEVGDFADDKLKLYAECWVNFHRIYGESSVEKFDKYAARLNEEAVQAANAQAPEAILAPYFVARSSSDPWWERSSQLFAMTRDAASGFPCVRVVAAEDVYALEELLADTSEDRVVVWVSGLDEYKAPAAELRTYRSALQNAKQRQQRIFALYGGFFSVLQASAGLTGAAHGVGFSEHRVWRELPQSGAPPARFYVPRWHRYAPVDLAQALWEQDSSLCECACEHCGGRSPIEMEYHDLMKHSVYCRQAEIDQWQAQPSEDAATALAKEHEESSDLILGLTLLDPVKGRALELLSHLPRWAEALR
jgi:hypothetical protein